MDATTDIPGNGTSTAEFAAAANTVAPIQATGTDVTAENATNRVDGGSATGDNNNESKDSNKSNNNSNSSDSDSSDGDYSSASANVSAMGTPSAGETKRRMLACKRCHTLKVKCVPTDPTVESSPCIRCTKKNVHCDYNSISKKRKPTPLTRSMKIKLKNDEVKTLREELARKDKLIKLLRGFTDEEEKNMNRELSSQERLISFSEEIKHLENISKNPISSNEISNSTQFIANSERRVQICESHLSSLDIIGNNLFTYEQCTKLIGIFLTKIHSRFPFIDLPGNLSIEHLREHEPLLFALMIYIAITLDVEPSNVCVEAQLQLECLISKSISLEILLIGNKSLQLLKNTILYCFWYSPPELFHHRRYHMFSSLCVSMAHDLGISGRPYFFYNKDDGSVKKTSMTALHRKIELKSLVLVVYLLYMSISLFLKRIVFLQWTDHLEECCVMLENTNMRSHKLIVIYAKMNHLMEMIYTNIHKAADHMTVWELSSTKNKLQMAEYLNQLNLLKQKICNNFDQNSSDFNSLMAYIYSVQAYLYEPAIQTLIKSNEYITKEYKDVFFSTLSQICESCLLSLKHFNELSIAEMASNSLFHTSRILYTSGMLLRIRYLSLAIPKSVKASLFTEECLSTVETLIKKVEETARTYPKNHFIKKVRIVLGLFLHTCLGQWYVSYKTLYAEIKKHTPLYVDPLSAANSPMNALNNGFGNVNPNGSVNGNGNGNVINNNGSPSPMKKHYAGSSIIPLLNQPLPNSLNMMQQAQSQTPQHHGPASPPTPILPLGSPEGQSNEMRMDSPSMTHTHAPATHMVNGVNGDMNKISNIVMQQPHPGSFAPNSDAHHHEHEDFSLYDMLNSNNPPDFTTAANEDKNWEYQYMAFNDEFWSDLFFGDVDSDVFNAQPPPALVSTQVQSHAQSPAKAKAQAQARATASASAPST